GAGDRLDQGDRGRGRGLAHRLVSTTGSGRRRAVAGTGGCVDTGQAAVGTVAADVIHGAAPGRGRRRAARAGPPADRRTGSRTSPPPAARWWPGRRRPRR